MWRNIASNALSLLVVALFVLGGVILWGQAQYKSAGPLDQAICLRVPPGSTMPRVSEDLEAQGAISSGAIFRMGAEYSDKTRQLKAGAFLVPEGASMEEIVDIVTRGGASTCGTEIIWRVGVRRNLVQVRELDPATNDLVIIAEFVPGPDGDEGDAIPAEYETRRAQADTRLILDVVPGVTSWQVIDGLRSSGFVDGVPDTVPPEGSLAPRDYEIRRGDTGADLIARMSELQSQRLAEAWANRVDGLPYDSPQEALIMASIVEKETGLPDERRQVASVFVNRLRQGMRLQTDPTVIYGVTNGRGILGRGLRQSELSRETPYNTYIIPGLPPTPIANPSLAAIEATMNPADTPYIFFVADGSGGHAFAETLAEHNKNVARWRQIESERAQQ